MFESAQTAIAVLLGATAVVAIVRNYRRHRDVAAAHPPDAFSGGPLLDETGWRPLEPAELGLARQDTPTATTLSFESHPASSFWAMPLFGVPLLVVAVWGVVQGIINGYLAGSLIAGAFIGGIGLALARLGEHLVQVTITAEDVELQVRWLWALRRRIRLKRAAVRRASGTLQSHFGMERDQDDPFYFLTVHRRRRSALRVVVHCNQSQGAWVADALSAWAAAATPAGGSGR